MKIKYLAGKLKDKVEDLDQVKAAELIDGGYAIEVNEPNPIDIAVEAMSEKISDIASKAAEKAANATLEKISKGLKSKPTISVGQDGWETDPAAGFKGVGDYLSSVIKMGQGKGVDERILKYNQKVTFSPMSDSTDGSIVPVEYSDQLINDIITENDFLEDCFKVPVTVGNSISVPCDNTTSLAAGGGVAAVVVGEGTQIQDSIASTRNVVFTLKKLATLIDVTEELLADTNIALPAYQAQKNEQAFAYSIASGILTSGNTAFGGILASGTATAPGVVTAAITGGTATGVVSYKDLLQVYASFYGDRKTAMWVCGPDTFSSLMNASDGSGRNVFLPVLTGGLKDEPYYTILGIPVVISHVLPALGSLGDIMLIDMSRYVVALKGGVETASTPFLHFDAQTMTFRTTLRIVGQPERVAPITTAGGLSVSPYVVLSATAR